jgi:signal transduction histidine kinase
MRLKVKLWHKIFLYSFFTVVFSQVLTLGWYLFTYSQDLRVKNMAAFLAAISEKIKALTDVELEKYIELYRIEYRRVWLEDAHGRTLLGEPWPGMSARERIEERIEKRYEFGDQLSLVLKQAEPSIVVICPVSRNGTVAYLCFNWFRGPLVSYWGVFVQGVAGLLGLSLFLSLWTAMRVSKPLGTLSSQVIKIAEGDLTLRLKEDGVDEVADVSRAVNELTRNLVMHINSMKQLMANMSHEMRSTVTNISMSLEIAQEVAEPFVVNELNARPKEKLLRNLAQARVELEILENMVASGVLGGRLDLRHEELERGPLDFSSLCRQVLNRHEHRAAHGSVQLVVEVANDLWVLGDEILLDRLLANILDNAIKYTASGGEIRVSLSSSENFLTLTCHNTHPPLTDEQIKSLVLPYYRVEQGRILGSGLGLYLAQRITVLHGGSFSVENTLEGLLFTIILPLPDENVRRTTI